MPKKYFTVEEAEQLLPDIKRHLLKILKHYNAFRMLLSLEVEHDDLQENALQQIRREKEVHHYNYHILRELEAIHAHGAIVKDIDSGLVDFYALYGGKEVFLCWQLGEEGIGNWHDIHTSFRERKPIALLKGVRG